ncbi:hypothetical protein [Labrys neptuniae]
MIHSYRLAGLLALALIWPAQAQEAPRKIFRGTVETIDTGTLGLKTKDGNTVAIHLTPDWKARLVVPVGVESIHPGSFIGTAQMPQADGSGRSLEVHVFPPGVKSGEGERDWDSSPGARMTNGTVGGEVLATNSGREVTLTFPGGSRKIVIPPEVPVVQFNDAERTTIKPGVAVFVVAQPDGNAWRANSVATGQNGAAPPM